MEDFVDWLTGEIRKQGWSNSELSRQIGVTSSAVSLIFTRRKKPSWKLCLKIAQVLDKPPIYVLRRAGLLPPAPVDELFGEAANLTEMEQKMLRTLRDLPFDDQEQIANTVGILARRPTQAEQEMLEAFRGLLPHEREAVVRMIDSLARGHEGLK